MATRTPRGRDEETTATLTFSDFCRFYTGGVQVLILHRTFSNAFPRLFLPIPSLPTPQNESTDETYVPKDSQSLELVYPGRRTVRQTVGLTNVMGRSPVSRSAFLRLLCCVNLCQSTSSICTEDQPEIPKQRRCESANVEEFVLLPAN